MSEHEVTTLNDGGSGRHGHTAGIYDIRNIIGALIGTYGIILTLMGLFGDTEGDKTGDVNANLWAGLALIVFGIIMISWARLRPVVVPEDFETEDDDRPPGH